MLRRPLGLSTHFCGTWKHHDVCGKWKVVLGICLDEGWLWMVRCFDGPLVSSLVFFVLLLLFTFVGTGELSPIANKVYSFLWILWNMHRAYVHIYRIAASNVPWFQKYFFLQIIFPLCCFDKRCGGANDGKDPPIEVMVVQLELVRIDTAHNCATETLYTSERKSVF